MSKYLKKCLIIYTSLALILVGMAGATYAITATDADQYVTRSEYSVDMSYIQLKLDEKESSLLGKINKYRSTDIKLTTFDTPDKQFISSPTNTYAGYHMGGNFFPRKKTHSSTQQTYTYGIYGSMYNRGTLNYRNDINIYRLWNGNYYVVPALGAKESTSNDSATEYYARVMCAVPVEDLPGWYLVLGAYMQDYYYIQWGHSLVKLDPKVPMPSNEEQTVIFNGKHTIRLKKDLWDYCGDYTTKLTTNVQTTTATSVSWYYARDWVGPLIPSWISSASAQMTGNETWTGVVDAATGDYILTFTGVRLSSGYYNNCLGVYSGANCMINRFIPKDNVEYLMGSGTGNSLNYQEPNGSVVAYPDSRYIGTGLYDDPSWEYEFVDGVNGIKYWHAVRKACKPADKKGTRSSNSLTFHYSLPIVY